MMELCKALEELHVELEELPLEQYRARRTPAGAAMGTW